MLLALCGVLLLALMLSGRGNLTSADTYILDQLFAIKPPWQSIQQPEAQPVTPIHSLLSIEWQDHQSSQD
jgi:hypothetical protein